MSESLSTTIHPAERAKSQPDTVQPPNCRAPQLLCAHRLITCWLGQQRKEGLALRTLQTRCPFAQQHSEVMDVARGCVGTIDQRPMVIPVRCCEVRHPRSATQLQIQQEVTVLSRIACEVISANITVHDALLHTRFICSRGCM